MSETQKSRWGILEHLLQNSGFNGSPVISSEELREYVSITNELASVMIDARLQPLFNHFHLKAAQAEKILDNRILKA